MPGVSIGLFLFELFFGLGGFLWVLLLFGHWDWMINWVRYMGILAVGYVWSKYKFGLVLNFFYFYTIPIRLKILYEIC